MRLGGRGVQDELAGASKAGDHKELPVGSEGGPGIVVNSDPANRRLFVGINPDKKRCLREANKVAFAEAIKI